MPASASQEMNKQAVQMERIVGELAAMVDGIDQKSSAKIETINSENNQFVEVKTLGKNTESGGKTTDQTKAVSPKQLIPMNDDDFKDF